MSRRKRNKARKAKEKPSAAPPAEPRPLTRLGVLWATIAARLNALARTRWAIPAALAVLTFAVYARSINVPLVYWDDDYYFFRDPRVQRLSLKKSSRILTKAFIGNYHPVTTFTYAFDRAVWGSWLQGFHLTQLAFYTGGVVLLYYLFRAALGSHLAAFVASSLYATHAIHVESVAWLACRKDVVCLVFYVAAILAYIKYARAEERRVLLYVLSIALGAAAMLSKGYAIVLPVALLAYDACFGKRIGRRQILEKLPFLALAVFMGVLAVLVASKSHVLLRLDIAWWQRLAMLCKVFSAYVGRTLLPVRLSAFYTPSLDWLNWGVAAMGALLGAGSIIGFLLLRRRLPAAAFGLALFLLPLGMVMNTFFTLPLWMADRFLFFPTIGSSLALTAGGLWLYWNEAVPRGLRRWVVPLASAATVIVYTALTVGRIGVWSSGVALWSDALRKQLDLPGSGPVTESDLEGRKRLDPHTVERLAKAYEVGGRIDVSRALLAVCRRLSGRTERPPIGFAIMDLEAGRYDEAIGRLRPLAEDGRTSGPFACACLGLAYKKKGELENAHSAYGRALELCREHGYSGVVPMIELGLLEFEAGRFEEAARWYRQAREEADPGDPRPVFNLALSLERLGSLDEAYRLCEKTLEMQARVPPIISFDFADAYLKAGAIAERLGRREEAVRRYEEVLRRAPNHREREVIRARIRALRGAETQSGSTRGDRDGACCSQAAGGTRQEEDREPVRQRDRIRCLARSKRRRQGQRRGRQPRARPNRALSPALVRYGVPSPCA